MVTEVEKYEALKRRADDVRRKIDQLAGRREAAQKAREEVEAKMVAAGVTPQTIDAEIARIEAEYRAAEAAVAGELSEAEEGVKTILSRLATAEKLDASIRSF